MIIVNNRLKRSLKVDMQKIKWLSPLLFLGILCQPEETLAHGARITYSETRGIQIVATYDQGNPMANAQVVIYAPNDPATPWLKGETDSQGSFSFVPDVDQPGNWDVQVRQSGHGSIISIPVAAESSTSETAITPATSADSDYTLGQKMLMSVSAVWGFVGTALFFSRQPRKS